MKITFRLLCLVLAYFLVTPHPVSGQGYPGAFAFLLAHEVGHHVLGHVDHPSRDKEQRRSMEAAADTWAINLLRPVRIH